MAAAPPEARKFTRGLNKPGTAAELRQSVSEAVRTSVLMVSEGALLLRTHTRQPYTYDIIFFLEGLFLRLEGQRSRSVTEQQIWNKNEMPCSRAVLKGSEVWSYTTSYIFHQLLSVWKSWHFHSNAVTRWCLWLCRESIVATFSKGVAR